MRTLLFISMILSSTFAFAKPETGCRLKERRVINREHVEVYRTETNARDLDECLKDARELFQRENIATYVYKTCHRSKGGTRSCRTYVLNNAEFVTDRVVMKYSGSDTDGRVIKFKLHKKMNFKEFMTLNF